MNRFSVYSLATILMVSLFLFQCKKNTPLVEPVVTFSEISNITATAASVGGKVSDDGGSAVTAKGICYSSTNTTPNTSDSKTSDGAGIGDFSSLIKGLSPGTTYNLRAYAINSIGTAYSSVSTFKTLALAPTVTTIGVTIVTSTSYSSGGNITDDGGSPVTVKGVCWATTTNPTIANNKTSDGTGIGSFTSAITGLTSNTQYYLRAYATNIQGTTYGDEISFKTQSSAPSIVNTVVREITYNGFSIEFNITNDNGSPITARGVCWGLFSKPNIFSSLKTTDGTGIGTLTSIIRGLASNQQYYIRAYATNSLGTTYGDELILKTQSTGTTVAGGYGIGGGGMYLNYPRGVFLDASGFIYVADTENHRIQKWALGAFSATTSAGYGLSPYLSDNQLNTPTGLFVDASGNIYIADRNNHRIQKWAPGAKSGTTVAGGNGSGAAPNQLNNPAGVFLDASGNIYVADSHNHRIQKWAPGATSGTTVAGGNGIGVAGNQFNFPQTVFVDALRNIYVADSQNHRVQKWAPGASFGTTVAGGGGQGSASNQLFFPNGVFLDASGNIYVADTFNHRIQKWVPGATFGKTVAGAIGFGSDANQLNFPMGVFLDQSGNIYVADQRNHRIQKWAQP